MRDLADGHAASAVEDFDHISGLLAHHPAAVLRFIAANAEIQNGDQLVTSGIDGVYPPGLPVAAVSNVERNAAYLFARITCKPLAGVLSHAQVLVVNWENKAPERPQPAEKSSGGKRSKRGG